jgi:putative membrane protein
MDKSRTETVRRSRRTVRISKLATLAAAAFGLTAGVAARVMAAPQAPQAAGQLDDAEIAGRVLAFDRAEVQTAEAVRPKLTSGPAWQLAQRLSVDNSARERDLEPLASPSQRAASDAVASGRAASAELVNLSGDALDKAYVAHEIEEHQSMLAALDNQLIPSARSEALQRQLVDVRAETAAQLAEAQKAQHSQKIREIMDQPPPDFAWGP